MGEGHDKEGIGGMEPLSSRRMLTRKIPRKRFLLHLLCLWTSIRKKDYLHYIKELKRRPELSLLRSRQASVSDLRRRQLIDGLTTITLRVMISLEFGNRHCRVFWSGEIEMYNSSLMMTVSTVARSEEIYVGSSRNNGRTCKGTLTLK
ncbi:hypothetical protein PIB30_004714 [Stylosanthes scabra]|uniref:Uncharacterized protein n=1 Tax=Stylosanthes scabra TaxID=79078 RepID=A0ABU6R4Z6_9FABA|nr:hypothetical protein [Stylosanthes scabra]